MMQSACRENFSAGAFLVLKSRKSVLLVVKRGVCMTDTQKAAALHLRSKGRSFAQIAAELDLSVNTVKSFCSRNKGGLLCLCCGTPIQQPKRTRQKKFCSDHCRMQWWNANSKEVNRKAMYEFTCACCGKTFQAYGNDHRKYCSRECYIRARFGGEQRGSAK